MHATPGALLARLRQLLGQLSNECARYSTDESAAVGIAGVLCDIFGSKPFALSLALRTLPPGLELMSTYPAIPEGAAEFSQGLSIVVLGSPDFACRPRAMLSAPTVARSVPWRTWWEEDPVYMLSGNPVHRCDLVEGCADDFEGFRIASPVGDAWQPMALLIAGENQAWPPGSAQLADVRQIAHEVLNSPALQQLTGS